MNRNPAIKVCNVRKTFGRGELAYDALRGVSLSIHPGELVMLVGPSGSGKTTLLSVIGAVLTPTSGQLQLFDRRIDGLNAHQLSELRREKIGFIFQDHNLIEGLSALDNVVMPLRMHGWSLADAARRAVNVLDRVGLSDRLQRKPAELSGGQRARTSVARAVAGAPQLILADEPTASLDAESGLSVTTLLRELNAEQHATVLIVTHDQRIIHLADRIVHIADGNIVDEGRKDHANHIT